LGYDLSRDPSFLLVENYIQCPSVLLKSGTLISGRLHRLSSNLTTNNTVFATSLLFTVLFHHFSLFLCLPLHNPTRQGVRYTGILWRLLGLVRTTPSEQRSGFNYYHSSLRFTTVRRPSHRYPALPT